MILRNHGTITVGRSVGHAFTECFYLEKAARAQLLALSCGRPLTLPPRAVVEIGLIFALDNIERARAIAEERQGHKRQADLAGSNRVTLDTLFDSMKAEEIKTINLIIKGDVQGSVETLAKTVTDANTSEVRVNVVVDGAAGHEALKRLQNAFADVQR